MNSFSYGEQVLHDNLSYLYIIKTTYSWASESCSMTKFGLNYSHLGGKESTTLKRLDDRNVWKIKK